MPDSKTSNLTTASGKSDTVVRKIGRWLDKYIWQPVGIFGKKLINRATGETQRSEALSDRAHDETYNSPAAQLARNKLAGVATTGMQSVPTDSSNLQPDGDPSLLTGLAGSALGMVDNSIGRAIDFIGLRKQKAEVDKIYTDIKTAGLDQEGKSLDISLKRATLKDEVAIKHYDALTKEQGLSQLVQNINLLKQRTDLTKKQSEALDLANSLARATMDSNIALAQYEADNAELDLQLKDYDLNVGKPAQLRQIEEMIAHYKRMDATAAYNAQTNRQNALTNYGNYLNDSERLATMRGYYDEQTRGLKFDNDAMQETYDDYVKALQAQYHLDEVAAKWAATHQWLKVVNSGAAVVGAGAATYAATRGRGKSSKTSFMSSFGDPEALEVGGAVLM